MEDGEGSASGGSGGTIPQDVTELLNRLNLANHPAEFYDAQKRLLHIQSQHRRDLDVRTVLMKPKMIEWLTWVSDIILRSPESAGYGFFYVEPADARDGIRKEFPAPTDFGYANPKVAYLQPGDQEILPGGVEDHLPGNYSFPICHEESAMPTTQMA